MREIKVSRHGAFADGTRKLGIVFPKEANDKIKIGTSVSFDFENNIIHLGKVKKLAKK